MVCVVRSLAGRGSRSKSQSRSERACKNATLGYQASGSSLVTDLIERGVVNCKPEPDGTSRWDSEAGGGLGVWGS